MEDVKKIPLTQGKFALVDASDFDWLNQWSWYYNRSKRGTSTGYAFRIVDAVKRLPMHRAILDATPGQLIDHKDGDGLNNRRVNLRYATRSQNGANRKLNVNSTVGYKGVIFEASTGKYRARISLLGKRIHLGRFDLPEDAAKAYNEAAMKLFGQFCKLNNVKEKI